MEELQTKRLASAAAIVMSSVVVSRITGFIREMLIPAKFGVGNISDIFWAAYVWPDFMFSLLLGGAISAAIIPVFSGFLGRKEEEDGWKAVGTFINIVFLAIVAACILGSIFAPQLIEIAAAGYGRGKPVQMALAVKLSRILFPSVAFLMLAGMCNGVLNSYQRFASSAYGPTLYNVLFAMSIFFFSNDDPKDNYGIEKVVIGILLSAVAYFLFQFSFAFKEFRKHYSFKIFFHHPGFRKLFLLAIPSLLASSVIEINRIVTTRFSTLFTEGSLTALRMADRTWQMPLGIIAQAMGVAMLPTLAAKYAVGEVENYKDTLMKALKTVLLLSMPSAVGFIVLGRSIIKTIFQFSDKVNEANIATTAGILLFYTIALISQSVVTILNRGFYAVNDTKTPLIIGTSTIAINIALSVLFYNFTALGVTGMALAYSIASLINASAVIYKLNRKINGMSLQKLLNFIIKILAASLNMGICLWGLNRLVPVDFISGSVDALSKLSQFIILGAEVSIGALIYFIIVTRLKVEEAQYIYGLVTKRLKRQSV